MQQISDDGYGIQNTFTNPIEDTESKYDAFLTNQSIMIGRYF